MQYDMERIDQPLVDETQPKAHVWTDIGKAEVEHSIFGKARIRVYRKKDEIWDAVRWTLLTVGIVVGAVWLINSVSRQPEIVYVAPPEPAAELSAPEVQQPVPPQTKPPVIIRKPAPQLQPASAPVVARPIASAPDASAPVLAKPVPVTSKPVELQTPVVASSAVTVTN